jgi:hypothetical protein
LVEEAPHKRPVGGSIPPRSTKFQLTEMKMSNVEEAFRAAISEADNALVNRFNDVRIENDIVRRTIWAEVFQKTLKNFIPDNYLDDEGMIR